MAIEVVQHKQTSAAAATLTITEAAVGNVLAVFGTQITSESAPTLADNGAGGTEGWTRNATEATGATAKSRTAFFIKKVTVAGVTELKLTPGAGGTAEAISVVELKNASTTIRASVAANKVTKAKAHKSGKLTSTSGDVVLVGDGMSAATATGLPEAWTSEPAGHVLNNTGTETTRCMGGYLVTTENLTEVVYIANHVSETEGEVLAVAVQPAAGGTTFTEEVKMRAGARVVPAEAAVFPTAETIRAGARTKPLAAAVFPAAVKMLAGARTSPSTALTISVAPSVRGGARMVVQAVLVAPTSARIRAGALVVVQERAIYPVSVSVRAGARLNPTVASPTPVGGRPIIFIFDE